MEYRLHIEGDYQPDTLPIERLVKYLSALNQLLGKEHLASLTRIDPGSVCPVAVIRDVHVPKVRERLNRVKQDPSVEKSFRQIDDLLAEDNATGELMEGELESGVKIVQFPGRLRHRDEVVAPFWQPGELQGRLVRVEGKDAIAHIGLLDGGREYSCVLSELLAVELSKHWHEFLRVYGKGRWQRTEAGAWVLLDFKVESYTLLTPRDLGAELETLQRRGLGWQDVDKPWEALEQVRHGGKFV